MRKLLLILLALNLSCGVMYSENTDTQHNEEYTVENVVLETARDWGTQGYDYLNNKWVKGGLATAGATVGYSIYLRYLKAQEEIYLAKESLQNDFDKFWRQARNQRPDLFASFPNNGDRRSGAQDAAVTRGRSVNERVRSAIDTVLLRTLITKRNQSLISLLCKKLVEKYGSAKATILFKNRLNEAYRRGNELNRNLIIEVFQNVQEAINEYEEGREDTLPDSLRSIVGGYLVEDDFVARRGYLGQVVSDNGELLFPRLEINDELLIGLAANGDLGPASGLRVLNFENTEVTAAGFEALARAGALWGVEEINLTGRVIGSRIARLIRDYDYQLQNLRILNLNGNNIGAAGALDLAAGNLGNLRELNLDNNYIGDEGAWDLAAGNLANLRELRLYRNQIGDAGARDLAAGNLENLEVLNLYRNNIGAAGARDLAAGNLENLIELNLGNNRIGNAGARDLAAGNLGNLIELNLGNNRIGNAGAQGLAAGNLGNLGVLGLSNNNIGDAGAQGLAAGNLENLIELNLSHNNIGAAGARDLAAGNLENLRDLNIGGNGIGDAGVRDLAAGNLENLRVLHLGLNNIGDAGAWGLAVGNLENLTLLNLVRNPIGAMGAAHLREVFNHPDMNFRI